MAATDHLNTPVTTGLDRKKLASVLAFMDRVRTEDPSIIVHLEVQRLAPYLAAFAKLIATDLAALPLKSAHPLQPLADPDALSDLFKDVATKTGNAILSEMLVVPESYLTSEDVTKRMRQFSGKEKYIGRSFTLGFLQVFSGEVGRSSSISVPVFAFDDKMMESVRPYFAKRMLQAFQSIFTAGNHDMQHHYSNQILNPHIAQTVKANFPHLGMQTWLDNSFGFVGDTAIGSYESWLMLNHARVRGLIETDTGLQDLEKEVDLFFRQLGRIGKRMLEKEPLEHVQAVTDYFGTMACFALMRFVPLDHPLMTRAINNMEEAVPQARALCQSRRVAEKFKSKNTIIAEVLDSYDLAGTTLFPKRLKTNSKDADFLTLKRLQLVELAPWIARLIGPTNGNDDLRAFKNNTADISTNMIDAAYTDTTSPFNRASAYEKTLKNGTHIRVEPDADRKSGTIIATYKNGTISRTVYADDGTAHTTTIGDGRTVETWQKNDAFHREDGPAYRAYTLEGTLEREEWRVHGQYHRLDGPAFISCRENGVREERWYQNGALHREDGPARLSMHIDGTPYGEEWHLNGKLHRTDGPAYRAYTLEGTLEREEWRVHGQYHRLDGPAFISCRENGVREERWYQNGTLHRDDGPAIIFISRDGTRTEIWFKNGVQIDPPKTENAASACEKAPGKPLKQGR